MDNKIAPRITKILKIERFKVTILWNNTEIREIDFETLFPIWEQKGDFNALKINDFEVFKQVNVSESRTLEWQNVLIAFTFKGKTASQPLDVDSDVLYQKSTLLRKVEPISIGQIIRKTREELGLTQSAVAANAGTTRHYISRIENEQSDIQMDTLQKIIELGLGKKMKFEIL